MESSTGIQVLITSHNCASYLNDCFSSIETALDGYKWMMVFCDDVSTDNTEEIINNYKTTTSADSVVYQKYNTRSGSIGEAKNRGCLLSLNYKNDYPVICFMDADDLMGEQRISGLLPHLSEEQPIVFGDYLMQVLKDGEWVTASNSEFDGVTDSGDQFDGNITTEMRSEHLTFGYWCTLVLSSLIPADGVFFREDIQNYDDFLTWWELKYSKDVNIVPISGFVTHYYKFQRPDSVQHRFLESDAEILEQLFNLKSAIHPVPGYTG
tara:strand:- start:250 stop:1047 length:798 start_codon:yes stop_codon:yes gene_type:complete